MRNAPSVRHLLILACLCLPACGTHRTSDPHLSPSRVFSASELREDLAYLQQAHAARHPRRHDSPPDADLEEAFLRTHAALDRPMTRPEAFRALARLNPAFRDAHTLLMPLVGEADPDDPDQTRFPLAVRLDAQGRLRVRGDWRRTQDDRLVADGTEVAQLNGVSSGALLDRLTSFSHGETSALRRHMLTVMFRHWLHAIEGWQGDFTLGLIEQGAPAVLGISGADTWEPVGPKASDAPSVRFEEDGIAILSLPTFDVDDAPDAYTARVDAAFARLRERAPGDLIIDVRGNTGGQSDAGAEVIRRLIDRPVFQGSRARQRLNEDNNGLFGYRGQAGSLVEMDVAEDGRIDPAPATERVQARLVLLIDAMTYSAGILFATTLQDSGLATLIGQPTGGYANQTGNMEPVTLPNTGFLAYIPSREFVRPNGDAREAPVIPDVWVDPDGLEASEEDVVLRCAIEYVREQRHGAPRRAEQASAPATCRPRSALAGPKVP